MQTIIAKFGGPAIATPEQIQQVARTVINQQQQGV